MITHILVFVLGFIVGRKFIIRSKQINESFRDNIDNYMKSLR